MRGCVLYLFCGFFVLKRENMQKILRWKPNFATSQKAHLFFPGNWRLKVHFALNQASCTKCKEQTNSSSSLEYCLAVMAQRLSLSGLMSLYVVAHTGFVPQTFLVILFEGHPQHKHMCKIFLLLTLSLTSARCSCPVWRWEGLFTLPPLSFNSKLWGLLGINQNGIIFGQFNKAKIKCYIYI